MKMVMILLGMMMLAGMAVAQGRAPGDFYPDSGTGAVTNPAYARGLTVYGSVETNDVMIFADRSGSKGRGTNFLALVSGLVSNDVAEEAAARIAGDAAGKTNHVAAVAAEALLRAQGDAADRAAALAMLKAFSATGGVYRLEGANWWMTSTNGQVVLWLIEDIVTIVSASNDFNGPPVGHVFYRTSSTTWTNGTGVITVFSDNATLEILEGDLTPVWSLYIDEGMTWPYSLISPISPATGTCVIDRTIMTNAYPLIKRVDALLRDGSQAMTGNLDMGGNSITNLSPNTIYFTDGRSLPSIIPSAGWRNETYWSIGMEERYQAIAETVTTTNQDVITYREIAGIGKINWQITPEVLRGFPDGAFGYSVSGSAGSIDQDGLLTMVSAGLVDVTVTNGATSKTAKVDLYYSSEGEERSVVYGGTAGSARAAAIAGIDGRLSGGGSAEYWLTNSPPSTFTTNPACWAAAADFSGVVVGTGTGAAAWYGTLITTQHILQCKHAYNGVGSVKRFRGRSGTNYVRTVTAIYTAGGDFTIGKLNAPLPPGDVKVYKVMPADYATYFPTDFNRMPGLIYNQNGRAAVCDMRLFNMIGQPSTELRLDYWELPYGGDSGRPCFLWIGNELVLMFLFSGATIGNNSPITYRDQMNALLAPDGTALTTVDLSGYTEF